MRDKTIVCYTNGSIATKQRFKWESQKKQILKRWAETYISWQYQIIPDEGEASEILTY